MICTQCNKVYKREGAFKKHQQNCGNKKKKKKRIPPELRARVWNTYIGQKTRAKCFCCWRNTITPFSNHNTFHAGHIISENNGGKVTLNNLLPICRDCNGFAAMGTDNWD